MRLVRERVPEPPAGLPGLAHRNQELARRGAPKGRLLARARLSLRLNPTP